MFIFPCLATATTLTDPSTMWVATATIGAVQ